MLYDFYDFSKQASGSAALLFDSASKFMLHDMFWPSRHLGAFWGALERGVHDYQKPDWDIGFVLKEDQKIPVIFYKEKVSAFCELSYFSLKPFGDRPTVFLVAPMSGHHATLLHDTIRVLLQDFDVCVTDWIDCKNIPLSEGSFSLSDYVVFIENSLAVFCGKHPNTTVFAVCQPAPAVLAAVARLEDQKRPNPKNMVLMGGPVDARQSPTTPNLLASKHPLSWFKDNLIHKVPSRYMGAGRRVYPGFLQHLGFWAMNPEKHSVAHFDYYENLLKNDKSETDRYLQFYNEYNSVMDLPAEFYLETIDVVFQRFLLAKGSWVIHGKDVDLGVIKKTRLLTIEGARDDIAGQGQTRAAVNLCTGLNPKKKTHYLDEKAGHYGLFSGSRWREHVYPVLKDFCLN